MSFPITEDALERTESPPSPTGTVDAPPLRLVSVPSSTAAADSPLGTFLHNLSEHRTRRSTELSRILEDGLGSSGDVAVFVVALPRALGEAWLRALAEPGLPVRIEAVPELPEVVGRRAPSAGTIEVGCFSMDLDRLLVTVGGRAPAFTHQEFLLLRVFLQSPGRVFSRKQLLDLAWDEIDVGGSRKVDVHVRRLRVKLGPQAASIVTVRGFGYRFSPH